MYLSENILSHKVCCKISVKIKFVRAVYAFECLFKNGLVLTRLAKPGSKQLSFRERLARPITVIPT